MTAAAPQHELNMWEGYLDILLSGIKKSTIRFQDPAEVGPITFVLDHAGRPATRVAGEVTRVETVTVAALTDEHAVRDGFANLAELRAALDHHYPGITPDAPVDIVHFELA